MYRFFSRSPMAWIARRPPRRIGSKKSGNLVRQFDRLSPAKKCTRSHATGKSIMWMRMSLTKAITKAHPVVLQRRALKGPRRRTDWGHLTLTTKGSHDRFTSFDHDIMCLESLRRTILHYTQTAPKQTRAERADNPQLEQSGGNHVHHGVFLAVCLFYLTLNCMPQLIIA